MAANYRRAASKAPINAATRSFLPKNADGPVSKETGPVRPSSRWWTLGGEDKTPGSRSRLYGEPWLITADGVRQVGVAIPCLQLDLSSSCSTAIAPAHSTASVATNKAASRSSGSSIS